MKTIKLMTLAAGLMLFQTVAHAEMISGTITSIDMSSQKVALQRADTDKRLIIHVKDASLLNNLKANTQVTVDAKRKLFGGWEAKAIDASAAEAEARTSANEASKSEMLQSREAVNSISERDMPLSSGNTVSTSADNADANYNADASGRANAVNSEQ